MSDFDHYSCRICNNPCCLNTVLSIIASLFLFTLGLVLGAIYYETFLPVIAVLIAAIAILALLFVLFLIIRFCNRR